MGWGNVELVQHVYKQAKTRLENWPQKNAEIFLIIWWSSFLNDTLSWLRSPWVKKGKINFLFSPLWKRAVEITGKDYGVEMVEVK